MTLDDVASAVTSAGVYCRRLGDDLLGGVPIGEWLGRPILSPSFVLLRSGDSWEVLFSFEGDEATERFEDLESALKAILTRFPPR
jgi:hypothetical protein